MSNIWSNFNKSAQIAIVVLVVVLGGSLWKGCSSESEIDRWRKDFAEFRETAQVNAQQLADSLNALTDSAIVVAEAAAVEADSLSGVIEDRDGTIEELQTIAEEVEVANDSTFDELTGGEGVEHVVEENVPQAAPWIRLTFSLRSENSTLRQLNGEFRQQVLDFERRDVTRLTEIGSLRAGLSFQTTRADSLHVIVLSIPEGPPREKFLFFNLPSRKTSFIVGSIVGVIGFLIFDNYMAGGN